MSTIAVTSRAVTEQALRDKGCSERNGSWDCPICGGRGKLGKLPDSGKPHCFSTSCEGHASSDAVLEAIGLTWRALNGNSGARRAVQHVDGQTSLEDVQEPAEETLAGLTEEHRQYLRDHAITDDVIDASGATSTERGIRFLYRGPKQESYQDRPDNPSAGGQKYLWPKGERNFLNIVRDDKTGPVLVVEGTKQTLAAASWAPDEYAVIGLSGCTVWHKHDWDFCEGRDVLICFDGDAATNRNVYDQAAKFGAELKAEGAASVKFMQVPLTADNAKAGLDDFLADAEESDRGRAMAKLIRRAANKPAGAKPAPSNRQRDAAPTLPETDGREMVAVNGDLRNVRTAVLKALQDAHDGKTLFNYGDVLARLRESTTQPLDEGTLLDIVADTAMLVVHRPATVRTPEQYLPGGRLDAQTVKIVMSSADRFTKLNRIVRHPFVRPDGTVCTAPGYDEDTATWLDMDPTLTTVRVPDQPAQSQAQAAARFLFDEWLGDFVFHGPAARAHALAFVITPFIRGLVPLVPMALVNGLEPSVGKGLFTDCVSIVTRGEAASPLQYLQNEEETRKQITASFAEGTDFLVFDEAHKIENLALSRALTAINYKDRILGATKMAAFPNLATWVAMGNQMEVSGDMARRGYMIDIKPIGTTSFDREAKEYRHPDLRAWTGENRAALVSAALIMVRAWFAAGKPGGPRSKAMGSFEAWDRMVDGILHHAGVDGFLSDVAERRTESDYLTKHWTAHLEWLRLTFSGNAFTARQAAEAALRHPGAYEAPPGLEDTSDKGYSRSLGRAYSQKVDRIFGLYQLSRDESTEKAHGNVAKWCVRDTSEDSSGGSGGSGGSIKRVIGRETGVPHRLPLPETSVSQPIGPSGGPTHPPHPPACTCQGGAHAPQNPFCHRNSRA